ncbi:MAG: hypothetical protein IJW60_04630 [Clostridia bacterium]|nr:hypothetical protein [Clostridia bacterium]
MNKQKRKVLAALCSAGMAVAITATALTIDNIVRAPAEKYEATLSETLAESYAFGSTFVVPQATLAIGGENVAATGFAVVFPNGTVENTADVVLDVSGQYTLVYYATVNGKTVSAEKTFKVAEYEWEGVAPVIKIQGGFESVLQAYAALGERVVLPTAVATDEHLVGGVECFVYYNYGTPYQVQVGVKDGAFVPNVAGEYTLVYSARDAYGNETTVERSVLASATQNGQAVTLTLDAAQGATAGTEISVPVCTVSGLYEDESGLQIYAVFGEEKTEISGGTFFAEHVGEYTLVYEYVTPIATYTANAKLTTVSDGVVLFEDYYLPKYFLKGAKYTLDSVNAVSYEATNPVRSESKAYMRQDGGAYKEVDLACVEITATARVQFKYEFAGKSVETEEFPVIDVNFGGDVIALENYFVGDLNKLTQYDGVLYTTKSAVEETTLDFVNVLSLSSFSVDLGAPTGLLDETGENYIDTYGKTSKIKIRLTDFYNRDNVVEMEYINEGGSTFFSLNGSRAVSLSRAFNDTQHKIQYDLSKQVFRDLVSGQTFAWKNSFTKDKILLEIVLVGCENNACVAVRGVGKQFIDESGADSSRPTIYVKERQGGSWNIGDEVLLNSALVTDELTPYLRENLTLSVVGPKGYLSSVDGVKLDGNCDVEREYTIKLTDYGVYKVTYKYTDQNYNTDTVEYSIFVYDRRAPSITLSGVNEGETKQVKAGTVVTLPEYSVSDGETEQNELDSWVMVFNPYGECHLLDNGKLTTNHKGTYRVVYYCRDTDGNYTTATYFVVAE